MISIGIIDDHWVLVDSLTLMLGQEPDLEFLGSADTLAKGRELLRRVSPDVLLLDVEMPIMNGLQVASKLHQMQIPVRILALSAYNDQQYILGMLANGARGYLTKDEVPNKLLMAIRSVAAGESD